MRVLVVNQYAGNKGDRAVLYFVLRELRRYGVVDITVSTHDRSFWPHGAPLGAKLVPWGWNCERPGVPGTMRYRYWWERRRLTKRVLFPLVRRSVIAGRGWGACRFTCNAEFRRALSRADVVISTGGHHITTRFARNAVSEMVYDLMHVHLARKPLVLWSQTIGPLEFTDWRCEQAVKVLLKSAWRIYVRDITSVKVLESIGIDSDRVHSTYESVFGLSDQVVCSYVPPLQRPPTVGVAIYNAEHRPPSEYAKYIKVMAAISDVAARDGMRVLFFPHEMKNASVNDRRTIREVIAAMTYREAAEVLDEDLDPVDHMRRVARCRMFIGHKTHSIVFALTVGTPLLAIAYHPKTVDFMAQYGLADHSVPEEKLTAERLRDVYEKIRERLDDTGWRQWETSLKLGQAVREHFRGMLQSLEEEAGRSLPGTRDGQALSSDGVG